MSPHIVIQWMGIRKDSGRGAVWAWFTETGKPITPNPTYAYGLSPLPRVHCHVIWGSIGKKPQIEEHELTFEFLQDVRSRANNFRQVDPEKIIPRWGKYFNEEISMYLLLLKMKG